MENPTETVSFQVQPHQDYRDRARLHLLRIQNDEEKRAEDRRTGRKAGKLTHTLRQNLRKCNPLQLKATKQECDRLIALHKRPPSPTDCRKGFTEDVLVSIPIKNKRYQLEIRRRIKRNVENSTIYFNGPYLYSYFRDGQYIKGDYLGKKEDWRRRKVPRKVQAVALPFTIESVVRERLQKIESEYRSGKRKLG